MSDWPGSEFAPCERARKHVVTQRHLPSECPVHVMSAEEQAEAYREIRRRSADYRGLCAAGREYFYAGMGEHMHLDDYSGCRHADLAESLQRVADETDDARDHDELHAAADVVRSQVHTEYIDRWVDELRKRWLE